MERKSKGIVMIDPSKDQDINGLPLTIKLMKNYQLLQQRAHAPAQNNFGSCPCDPCVILENLRCSKARAADVVREVDQALEDVQVAADARGCGYKVEAFRRHYIQGETYEIVAERLNCGKNSPDRWCKEIMKQMAVRLFGYNGIF